MPIETLTFAQLQELQATVYSSVAALPANTDAGSTLGSIFNAESLLALNVQYELVYAAAIARLATSFGADVDTFVNPFGVFRLGASFATGEVTLGTSSPVTSQLLIPVGGVLTTNTGLLFTIVADPTNSTGFYDAALNAYVIQPTGSTANVLVQCNVAGTIGNVGAGQILQLYTPVGGPTITGISSVSNTNAFGDAVNQESDAALKTRFALFISTGSVATVNALAAAVLAVEPNLTYTIGDPLTPSGASAIGNVTVVVNTLGSSAGPTPQLLAQVQTAVNNVRSAGITVTVIGPSILAINVTANVHVAAAYSGQVSTVLANAIAQLQEYLNNIGLSPNGATLQAQLSESYVALRTTTGVANVTSLLLNGAAADVNAGFGVMVIAGNIVLTPV